MYCPPCVSLFLSLSLEILKDLTLVCLTISKLNSADFFPSRFLCLCYLWYLIWLQSQRLVSIWSFIHRWLFLWVCVCMLSNAWCQPEKNGSFFILFVWTFNKLLIVYSAKFKCLIFIWRFLYLLIYKYLFIIFCRHSEWFHSPRQSQTAGEDTLIDGDD